MRFRGSWLLSASLILLVTGCDGFRGGAALPVQSNDPRFTLAVSGESFVDGGRARGFGLAVQEQRDSLLVSISVRGAENLKALYCDIGYDPLSLRPLIVEPTEAMGPRDEILSLEVKRERGSLHYGQVLANFPAKAGLQGSAIVAQAMFAREPLPLDRSVSTPTSSPRSVTSVDYSIAQQKLSWYYRSTGDYDQNGAVTISDLTPLCAHFGEAGAPVKEVFSELSVIDGDGNGELNLADITPIGANFGASCQAGYNVYAGQEADCPPERMDANGAGARLIGHVDFAAAEMLAGQRLRFSIDLPEPVAQQEWFWVRPSDGESDGARSNALALYSDTPRVNLPVPPTQGAGSAADPYLTDTGVLYELSFVHPLQGDVAADPLTSWTVEPPSAGLVDVGNGQALFTVRNSCPPQTPLELSGSYNSEPESEVKLNFRYVPVGGLVQYLADPPEQGSGTYLDPFIVDIYTDYNFVLWDDVDGDVSVSPDAHWRVEPAGAASVDKSGAVALLNLADYFFGELAVAANYKGEEAVPQWIYLYTEGHLPEFQIYPDPADADWPPLMPIDKVFAFPYYILSDDNFNTDFSMEFSLLADSGDGDGGSPIQLSGLEWHAFPADWLVDWPVPGTVKINTFTHCFIFALDDNDRESNHIEIEAHSLPKI